VERFLIHLLTELLVRLAAVTPSQLLSPVVLLVLRASKALAQASPGQELLEQRRQGRLLLQQTQLSHLSAHNQTLRYFCRRSESWLSGYDELRRRKVSNSGSGEEREDLSILLPLLVLVLMTLGGFRFYSQSFAYTVTTAGSKPPITLPILYLLHGLLPEEVYDPYSLCFARAAAFNTHNPWRSS